MTASINTVKDASWYLKNAAPYPADPSGADKETMDKKYWEERGKQQAIPQAMGIGEDALQKLPWQVAGEAGKSFMQPLAGHAGHKALEFFVPRAVDRVHAEDIATEAGAKALGQQLGNIFGEGVGSLVSGGQSLAQNIMLAPRRKRIFDQLMESDPIISRADPETVLKVFHTMKRFAPMLSTDFNAVQAFLREGVVHEGAVNYNTIGALSKAEQEAQKALGMGTGGRR